MAFLCLFFAYMGIHTSPVHWKLVASLHPAIALACTGNTLLLLETAGISTSLATLTTSPVVENYSVLFGLLALGVDIIWYILLGIYLGHVVPGTYGESKRIFFCLQCGSSSRSAADPLDPSRNSTDPALHSSLHLNNTVQEKEDQKLIEPVPAELLSKVALTVTALGKEFPGVGGNVVRAVHDLSFQAVEGQILALLGHNGAGKSTAMHMLTGLYPASRGDALVYGFSIRSQMDQVRKLTGFCPQHDIIFPGLTVFEHLVLLARIKGCAGDVSHVARDMATRVDLGEKLDVDAQALSGGQKRKLCLGMALLGDSKAVYLDEPTSGMDPSARAKVINIE
jgi:ABC-type Na+ transport system ATPase subunit NatA